MDTTANMSTSRPNSDDNGLEEARLYILVISEALVHVSDPKNNDWRSVTVALQTGNIFQHFSRGNIPHLQQLMDGFSPQDASKWIEKRMQAVRCFAELVFVQVFGTDFSFVNNCQKIAHEVFIDNPPKTPTQSWADAELFRIIHFSFIVSASFVIVMGGVEVKLPQDLLKKAQQNFKKRQHRLQVRNFIRTAAAVAAVVSSGGVDAVSPANQDLTVTADVSKSGDNSHVQNPVGKI